MLVAPRQEPRRLWLFKHSLPVRKLLITARVLTSKYTNSSKIGLDVYHI